MKKTVVLLLILVLGFLGYKINSNKTDCNHDPNEWHAKRDDKTGCVYGHDHGDNPGLVNDIFGKSGEWFGEVGREISYPWQTFKVSEKTRYDNVLNLKAEDGFMENTMKHEGYFWKVKRDLPCEKNYCVRAFRIMYHNHATMDMNVRWHSASFEAYVCKDANNKDSCGVIRTGGWFDFGYLFKPEGQKPCEELLKDIEMRKKYRHETSSDEQFMQTDFNLGSDLIDEFRCHFTDRDLVEWWGHGGSDVRFQITIDSGNRDVKIGYFLPVNLYYVDGYINKGIVNMPLGERYINRFGRINNDCKKIEIDCIPIEYTNVYLSGDIFREVVGFSQQDE